MSLVRLSEACRNWKPLREGHVEPFVAITAAWPAIVGAQVAENSRPLEVRGETLIVATRSSSWTHQLSFMTEQMLAAIASDAPDANIKRVRFRVGRVAPLRFAPATRRPRGRVLRKAAEARPPARTLSEVIARFQEDVRAMQLASGGRLCRRCGIPLENSNATWCLPCLQAETDRRHRVVARLLFEAPWLGYAGTAALVDGLTERDYGLVRLKLLRRWWETLQRARRARRLSPDGRERLIASSYVILTSGLDPEHIVPAVVRNVLGDELHDLIYGISN